MHKVDEKAIEQLQISLKKIGKEENEALIHALVDIQDSFENIYNQILPKLTEEKLTEDEVRDLLWDVREEFRHIKYHIQDSNILEI
jgi:predicted  nucleic acid-binding Zn-ribbon protein